MNQKELDNLKCGDIIQCTNHPQIKGRAVTHMECQTPEDNDSRCGCKAKDWIIVRDSHNKRGKE